jgi:hypothetical protein
MGLNPTQEGPWLALKRLVSTVQFCPSAPSSAHSQTFLHRNERDASKQKPPQPKHIFDFGMGRGGKVPPSIFSDYRPDCFHPRSICDAIIPQMGDPIAGLTETVASDPAWVATFRSEATTQREARGEDFL